MNNVSRRTFVKCSGGLLAFAFTDLPSLFVKEQLPLSFSTLGCPDWSLDQILEFAKKHQYSGIEIRGIQRELDLVKSSHFNSSEAIEATKKKFRDARLKIVALGSSAAMHHSDETERKKSFDEARRFIDLAKQVECPFIRVFPDKLPQDKDKAATLELITKGLNELGAYAKGSGVNVLMETHGDVVHTADIETVMKGVNEPNVGLVWDISNMWMVTKEPPAEVHGRLKRWIRHTHLKDLRFVDGKHQYTLMAMGEVPVLEAVDLLVKDKYKGYLSFEWEKLWHPEIEEPEIAFTQYAQKMREHFAKK